MENIISEKNQHTEDMDGSVYRWTSRWGITKGRNGKIKTYIAVNINCELQYSQTFTTVGVFITLLALVYINLEQEGLGITPKETGSFQNRGG